MTRRAMIMFYSIVKPVEVAMGAKRFNCSAIVAANSCGEPPVGSKPGDHVVGRARRIGQDYLDGLGGEGLGMGGAGEDRARASCNRACEKAPSCDHRFESIRWITRF